MNSWKTSVTLKKQLKNLTQLPFLYFKKIGMVQTVARLGKFTLQQSEKLQLMKKNKQKLPDCGENLIQKDRKHSCQSQ